MIDKKEAEERTGLLSSPWFVLGIICALAIGFALDAPDIWQLAGIFEEGK